MKKPFDYIVAYIIIIAVLLMCILGCSVNKNKTQTNTQTVSQLLKEKEDSLRVLRSENELLMQQIRELTYAGITFDTSDCPETSYVIPKDCNVDSILRILDRYRDQVKLYADGTIEINAKLKGITYTKERLENKIQQIERSFDSLLKVKQKENYYTVTKTVTKEKEVKRGFHWLWALLIGIVIGSIGTFIFLHWWNKKVSTISNNH